MVFASYKKLDLFFKCKKIYLLGGEILQTQQIDGIYSITNANLLWRCQILTWRIKI